MTAAFFVTSVGEVAFLNYAVAAMVPATRSVGAVRGPGHIGMRFARRASERRCVSVQRVVVAVEGANEPQYRRF